MLEHFGYDRYLEESAAEPVHRDETGVLWRVPLPGDEDVVMVEVVNSTPEPDGTHRTYWLRVPPSTRTAKDGVAWTFGLGGEEYAPCARPEERTPAGPEDGAPPRRSRGAGPSGARAAPSRTAPEES